MAYPNTLNHRFKTKPSLLHLRDQTDGIIRAQAKGQFSTQMAQERAWNLSIRSSYNDVEPRRHLRTESSHLIWTAPFRAPPII